MMFRMSTRSKSDHGAHPPAMRNSCKRKLGPGLPSRLPALLALGREHRRVPRGLGDGLRAVIGPLVWGDGYLYVVPLYRRWDGNQLLFPVAWKIGDSKGVGPVWWGRELL